MIQSLMEAVDPKGFTFTPAKREELRKAYNEAREAGVDTFVFHDHELVTDYAKYLLEYLDMVLVTTH